MGVEGAIRTARSRREPGRRSAQAVPRPPDDRSDGHATALRTCLVIPRHRVVDRSRIAYPLCTPCIRFIRRHEYPLKHFTVIQGVPPAQAVADPRMGLV